MSGKIVTALDHTFNFRIVLRKSRADLQGHLFADLVLNAVAKFLVYLQHIFKVVRVIPVQFCIVGNDNIFRIVAVAYVLYKSRTARYVRNYTNTPEA